MNTGGGRRWLYATLVMLVVAITTLGSLTVRARSADAADAGAPSADAPRSAVLTVTAVEPRPMRWPEQITANGNVAAWQEAVVSAEVGGLRIADVLVDVGDQVTKGQVLVRFDEATQQANVAQQRAAVVEANANLAEAESNAKRANRLHETGAISEQDLIQLNTRAEAAAAQVESAKARLQSAELMLRYTEVVAPDDGVISARSAMLGSVSAPGAELFRLVRQNRLEWRAELTSAQLAAVRVGMPAQLELPDGTTVTGTVRQVAPVLDPATRIGLAYVELDRATSSHARAGMYALGTITAGETSGLELPAGAVFQRDGHDYVFVLDAEFRVLLTKVSIGRRRGDAIEIRGGVSERDRIVASGAAFLNDGDRVRVAAPGEDSST